MLIGEKIQQLRRAKKMSLTELSKASGVQLATLSRMENLKMTGTLESHIAIAKALGASIAQLYQGVGQEESDVDLQAQGASEEIFLHDKAHYQMLTSRVMEKKLMPLLLKIEPAAVTQPDQHSMGTEKFVFCLEGKIEVVINDKPYSLSKHTTLYFNGALPHYFKNAGKTIASAICVITPAQI